MHEYTCFSLISPQRTRAWVEMSILSRDATYIFYVVEDFAGGAPAPHVSEK